MKKSYSSQEIIQIIRGNGWYYVDCDGDHHHYKHPTKKGKVTVTHPVKDVSKTVLKGIAAVTGLKF